MTETFDLIDYEVWGNEQDGWEVNDLFKIQSGLEFEEVNKQTVLDTLKEVGYLKETVTLDMLDIELEEFHIYVNESHTSRPLCEFRKVEI